MLHSPDNSCQFASLLGQSSPTGSKVNLSRCAVHVTELTTIIPPLTGKLDFFESCRLEMLSHNCSRYFDLWEITYRNRIVVGTSRMHSFITAVIISLITVFLSPTCFAWISSFKSICIPNQIGQDCSMLQIFAILQLNDLDFLQNSDTFQPHMILLGITNGISSI